MSVNFDRAADYYDASRGYTSDVATAIGRGLADAVGAKPTTRFLEIGIGTGRIALTLAEHGYQITGVDISERMLARLREKLEERARAGHPLQVEVRQADMLNLPFADGQFDVVIASHVFHLVADPSRAVNEAFRVLRPHGSLLMCGDQVVARNGESIDERWRAILESRGLLYPSPSEASDQLIEALCAADPTLKVEETRPVSWQTSSTPADEIETIRKRMWSHSWRLTESEFSTCIAELDAWYAAQYAGRDRDPQPGTFTFVIRRLYRHGTTV